MNNFESKQINIIEAYIKNKNQFIVLIIGLPCSNKSELAKELAIDLKLPLLNINDFIISNKFIEKEVENVKFNIYEHPDNYDWEKFNQQVNVLKGYGIIIYGNYIDIDKIKFDIDFSFFINMNINLCKIKLIEKKLLPYEKDDDKVNIYLSKIFIPIYKNLKDNLKVNKFFNIKEDSNFNEIYDDLFDSIIQSIELFLYKNKKKYI